MFTRLAFIVSVLLLSVFPGNAVMACGSHTPDPPTERSCCQEEPCDTDEQPATCPCDHDKGDCNCPGCGTASSGAFSCIVQVQDADFTQPALAAVQKQAFYFADHLPEAVHLPIWHPPQL